MSTKPIGPTAADIKGKLLRKWDRGVFYSSESEFPLRLPLGSLPAAVLTERFDEVRRWIAHFEGNQPYEIEWKEINHRLLGKQRLPGALIFDCPEQLARFLGKLTEWRTFRGLLEQIASEDSRLAKWAESAPFDLIAAAGDLERLILLWRWMVENPKPDIYLRQIDLLGIDTKFTEGYKKILSAWLDLTLAEDSLNGEFTGVKQFERRYGYKGKPEQVRLRFLDPDLYWYGCSDITLDSKSFCRLYGNSNQGQPAEPSKIFIVENDITALSFPMVKGGVVLFGRGYSFDHWRSAQWLHRGDLWYWGDLDTHGFCILDQFRSVFEQTRSFLMDRETLLAHESSWTTESKPADRELTRLTTNELSLYDDLRFNRIGENLRLEQEFVGFGMVESFLSRVLQFDKEK